MKKKNRIKKEWNFRDSLQDRSQQLKKANHLFERSPDEEYIKEWTESLRRPSPSEDEQRALSVLIFRLGQEWLAWPTIFLKEVTQRKSFHRIPHRSGKILRGIVNLNGGLQLYVALNELLDIEMPIRPLSNYFHYQLDRMVAISKEGELWVFPVDEIDGIYNWNILAIKNAPINISKSSINYIKGVMKMDTKKVGLLDEELIFCSLKRSL